MANPKRKISKGRRDRRRFQAYTRRLTAPNWTPCPRCHEPKLPHFVCPSCGFYKGRRVLVVKERSRSE